MWHVGVTLHSIHTEKEEGVAHNWGWRRWVGMALHNTRLTEKGEGVVYTVTRAGGDGWVWHYIGKEGGVAYN